MKKILAFILMVALALSLMSCSGKANSSATIPEETQPAEAENPQKPEKVEEPQEVEEDEEPQETEEAEETTEEMNESSAEPASAQESSSTEEPASTSDDEKESILFDEDGNTVSIEEFIDEYQFNLSMFSIMANGKLYTLEKPEDSELLYFFYEHEDANSAGVQTHTTLCFSNSGNEVGPDGKFNKIILMSTIQMDNEDDMILHMIAASQLMYLIDPSENEYAYLDLVSKSMQLSVESDDGTFSFGKNDIKYTFNYIDLGNNLGMLGVGADF